MSLVKFENVEIVIEENDSYEFLLTTKDVAKGFGCNQDVIRQSKYAHENELLLNKHFIETKNAKNQKLIKWTKKGIVRLGFFIKSEQAKKFRDWAEDYIVNNTSKNDEAEELKKIILAQNRLIASQPQIHPKSKLQPSEHNAMLDIVYQMSAQNKDTEKMIRSLQQKQKSISNFLNVFITRYPELQDYVKNTEKNAIGTLH